MEGSTSAGSEDMDSWVVYSKMWAAERDQYRLDLKLRSTHQSYPSRQRPSSSHRPGRDRPSPEHCNRASATSRPESNPTHSRASLSAGTTPSNTSVTTIFFHPSMPPSVPPRSVLRRNSENLPLTMSRMLSMSPWRVRASRNLFSL
jgi:hypothetical protein